MSNDVQLEIPRFQGELVRNCVEVTRNLLLVVEADSLCGTQIYALLRQNFKAACIDRGRHREASFEAPLSEMYPASVSVRRVKNSTEALWSTRESYAIVSNLARHDRPL